MPVHTHTHTHRHQPPLPPAPSPPPCPPLHTQTHVHIHTRKHPHLQPTAASSKSWIECSKVLQHNATDACTTMQQTSATQYLQLECYFRLLLPKTTATHCNKSLQHRASNGCNALPAFPAPSSTVVASKHDLPIRVPAACIKHTHTHKWNRHQKFESYTRTYNHMLLQCNTMCPFTFLAAYIMMLVVCAHTCVWYRQFQAPAASIDCCCVCVFVLWLHVCVCACEGGYLRMYVGVYTRIYIYIYTDSNACCLCAGIFDVVRVCCISSVMGGFEYTYIHCRRIHKHG